MGARDAAIATEATARSAADTAHANLTNPHSATSAATASRLALRDASGRAQFADPAAAQDAATRAYVDGPATPAWQNITTFLNGWVAADSVNPPQYYIDRQGIIRFRGHLKNPSATPAAGACEIPIPFVLGDGDGAYGFVVSRQSNAVAVVEATMKAGGGGTRLDVFPVGGYVAGTWVYLHGTSYSSR
jgi:hypothetical protein